MLVLMQELIWIVNIVYKVDAGVDIDCEHSIKVDAGVDMDCEH